MSRRAEPPDPGASGSGAVVRGKFRPARGLVASVRPEPRVEAPRVSRTRSERLARQLALAHWIERAVEEGRVGSYGEVARALGLTESRITQITALLGLSPAVQERVLFGEGGVGIREAIRAAREVEWPRACASPVATVADQRSVQLDSRSMKNRPMRSGGLVGQDPIPMKNSLQWSEPSMPEVEERPN